MTVKISEIEALSSITSKYVVNYIAKTAEAVGEWVSVTDEAGATAVLTAEKAFSLANKLSEYQTNAVNIKIKKQTVAPLGGTEFVDVFIGKTTDVSTWTITGTEL